MTTQTTIRCGFCGREFSDEEMLAHHGLDCESMTEQLQREGEIELRRRQENQLWEEEHAAGRI